MNWPSSERATLDIVRVEKEVLPLDPPSMMLIRSPLLRTVPCVSHDMLGAGTPNAVHWSLAVSPTTTSGPTTSTISGGSGRNSMLHIMAMWKFSY